MKKVTLIIGLVVLVVVVFGGFEIFKKYSQKEEGVKGEKKDEYGCLESGGYFYNPDIGICLFKNKLYSRDEKRVIKIAVETAALDKINDIVYTVVDISKRDCEDCFSVILDKAGDIITVDVEAWTYARIRPNKVLNIRSEDLELKNKAVNVKYPAEWSFISSPVEIRGEARGYWFFEGDFPVVLNDNSGNILAKGNAKAQGGWMTENFVPFTLNLEFDQSKSKFKYGVLLLKKDNPSGLAKYDQEVSIPIYFK